MIKYVKDFKFFCQKVLPLVYDDSLSYYEVLCKAISKMNEIAKKEYEKMCGPLTHMHVGEGEYRWLNDPWPWEYAKNREV